MPNDLDPRVEQWYSHLDKGQRFVVTAVDQDNKTVEIQHFDGDLEEYSLDEWSQLDIDLCEAPENWTGALDIGERDDLGTGITDTSGYDWSEPLEEFPSRQK